MAGRSRLVEKSVVYDGAGGLLEPVRGLPKKQSVVTASDVAEQRLCWLVVRADKVLARVLRDEGAGGLTDEELSGKTAAWRLRVGAAEAVLKLALGTRVRSGASKKKQQGSAEGTVVDAEDEPEDDSGVQELLRRLG